jgi:DNA-binding CsgD family transcriptional regulator
LAWPAVQSAAAEGVVEVEGSGLRFTHPLFASAIYSGAAPWRRREAHRRLSLIAATAEEQARHQALAAEGPDEEAAGALARAAHAAAARGAPGAAAELAELAVARTPAGLAPARRSRRLAAAEYLYRAGDTARARHGLEAVAQDMPSGPERAAAHLVLARILLHDEGELVALPVLEDALAEASPDRILQARIRISLARTMGGDLRYCARHADAGLALARQAGDQALVRQALAEKLYNDFMLGGDLTLEPDGMVSECEPERGPAAVEERPVTILGLCLVRADRFDEARRLLERALQAAQEEGEESSQPILLAYLADLECWAGNWQAAECYAAQAWDVGEQVDHRAWRSVTCYARALIDAHLGRIDAARAEAADGLSTAAAAAGDDWAVLMLHAALGFAELSAGNVDAAETSLSHAAGLADRIGLAEPAAWRFHANHVEALVGLGDLDRAGELLGWLEVRGRATGRRWTLATAARCRGLLLAARGDTPGALRVLDEALRHHQHLAMPFELGRTLLVTGQLQRRAKRKALARQHLERALGIFESLPAPIWAARARTELSRIGLRPPAPLELTATEERVATLAASGHTNRQVAAELFLSPRTVEDNLARAYRKLGVSSRAELGAAMTRRESAKPLPELSGAESMPVPRLPARCSSPAVGSPVRGNTGFVAGGRAPTVSVTGSPPGRRRIRKGQTDVPHREHRKGQAGQAEDEDSCVHDIVVRAFRRRDAFHRLRRPYMKAAAKGASSELRAQMSWEYGTLATEVYEFDKPVGRPFADVEYYTGLLADVSGPILEPATGTGRILIPLLEAGHQVDGLDSSPQMLACCRQHCRDRSLDPVLREADMTVFVQLAAYEAVIIPAGSIALLDGRKATLQALTCFRDSLVPGGRLVVDVPVPRLAAGHEAMRYWRRGSCLWTLQTMHLEYDPAANQTTRFLRYDKWQDGTLRMTELQTFRLQHWNCREFEDLLAETGFTHVLVAADYENAATPRAADSVWTFHATVPDRDSGRNLDPGRLMKPARSAQADAPAPPSAAVSEIGHRDARSWQQASCSRRG